MRIRFLRAWGPYAKGEVRDNPSATTVRYLCDVYHVAEVVPEVEPKAIDAAPRDKMVRKARKAKAS